MGGYVLSCESTVGLSREHLARQAAGLVEACFSGPGTVALFFWGSLRED